MFSKNKSPFLLALGFFLIAVSPLYGNKYLNIIAGLVLILISVLRSRGN
ncbi:hypothetical protein [Streptococcus ruminantium]|uniref:Uncharacterized protein n=1 Tax=Streptococcus ruminantium TaxID=1917441 RepID=A0A2Z5TTK9_9STRE|nr:hypothetical protein [Streptococcus ruminantium]BBA93514.1 hypothetical protein SR187_9565 [Streptococcus ruminantium]